MSERQTTASTGNTLARLREQFNVLSELSVEARQAWLLGNVTDPEERIALERLLDLDSSEGGFLDTPLGEHAARLSVDANQRPESLIGQRIGSFRLTRLLGRGGMAAVFLGERDEGDFRQHVAVKLLRRGLFSEFEQRMFRRERQLLASLDHPNIAHLIDGGITEAGIPYLVIEFVDGASITDYASQQQLNLRQRLELLLIVCRAVEAAHRALIVHRDIKPANVLVATDGTVKLLDFGIAKLLEEEMDTATFGVFTPDYAAPEQISGAPITTATDVYALGVLLHELLLGVRPHGDPPRRPSAVAASSGATTLGSAAQLAWSLRGDLDTILMKAMAAEPEMRYPSAGALANDIERQLAGLPVTAHPPSKWYRTTKFVHRHRSGVAITLILLIAILAALATTLWQTNIARHELKRANAMRDFMFSAFAEAEPSTPRPGPPSIIEVVDAAIDTARADMHMDPSARTELLTELGAVLRRQGHLPSARDNSRANFAQAEASFGADSLLTRQAGHELAEILILTGDFAEARTLIDRLLSNTPSSDASLRARLLMDSATLATKQDEKGRSLSEGVAGVQLARGVGDSGLLRDTLEQFGNVQLSVNDISGAIVTFEELLAEGQREFGTQHVKVASTEAALSRAYRRAGDLKLAAQHARAAVAIDDATLPADNWRRSVHLNALVLVLREQGDYRAALEVAKEDLRITRIAYLDDHPDVAMGIGNVGMLYVLLEDYAKAVPLLEDALRRYTATLGADNPTTAATRANYGFALAESGDASGEAQLSRGLEQLEAMPEPNFAWNAAVLARYARLKLDRHETSGALMLIGRLDQVIDKFSRPDEQWRTRSLVLRATAQMQLGDYAGATVALADADADLGKSGNADAALQAEVALLDALVASNNSNAASARSHANSAMKLLSKLSNPPHRLLDYAARVNAELPQAIEQPRKSSVQ